MKKKEYWKYDGYHLKSTSSNAFPLPLPCRRDKSLGDDKGVDKHDKDATKPSTADEKLIALRCYRRAGRLCEKCADKWNFGHKCSTTAPWHAMEELWELLQCEEVSMDQPADTEDADLHTVVSLEAISGRKAAKTLRFQGSIQGMDVIIILLDYGSSHTFLSMQVAPQLKGVATTEK